MGDVFMKMITYFCNNCLEPHVFNPDNDNGNFLCPTCGNEMEYWCTEDIDSTTNKVTNRSSEKGNPEYYQSSSSQQPTPKCPTCGSTDIEKISLTSKAVGGFMFGMFSSNVRNTMHCKHCGYKW